MALGLGCVTLLAVHGRVSDLEGFLFATQHLPIKVLEIGWKMYEPEKTRDAQAFLLESSQSFHYWNHKSDIKIVSPYYREEGPGKVVLVPFSRSQYILSTHKSTLEYGSVKP